MFGVVISTATLEPRLVPLNIQNTHEQRFALLVCPTVHKIANMTCEPCGRIYFSNFNRIFYWRANIAFRFYLFTIDSNS